MHISRREWLRRPAAFAAALPAMARARSRRELRPLRFAVGLKAMAPPVINCVIGEMLGYNAAEGFTHQAAALGTNSNVQVAIDKGDVDIGIGVPSFGLPLLAKGEWQAGDELLPVHLSLQMGHRRQAGIADQELCRSEGQEDRRFGFRRHRKSGHQARAEVARHRSGQRREAGFRSATASRPGVALQRGSIDALAYYDTGFGQIEGANIPLSYLPRPANLPMIGGQFLTAKKAFITGRRAKLRSVSAARWPRRPRSCWPIPKPARGVPQDVSRDGAARQHHGGRDQGRAGGDFGGG